MFQGAGIDLSKPAVLTCGGAVVAPFVAFAASLVGAEIPVYDVSPPPYHCDLITVVIVFFSAGVMD